MNNEYAILNRQSRKLARLIILRSSTGDYPWEAVPPDEVPDWVKDPDIIGSLVKGNMAQKEDAMYWYRAEPLQ